MPKEVIQRPIVPDNNGGCGAELSVHWTKNTNAGKELSGIVSIATTRHVWIQEDRTSEDPDAYTHTGHRQCAKCQVPPAGCHKPWGDPETVYVNMSRHDINRLISTLRAARDQAFGSDA